jgi:hypothetical protein
MLQVVFHIEAEMLGNGALTIERLPVGQPSVIASRFAGQPGLPEETNNCCVMVTAFRFYFHG